MQIWEYCEIRLVKVKTSSMGGNDFRWEAWLYTPQGKTTILSSDDFSEYSADQKDQENMALIAKLGSDGWEVYSVSERIVFYLKRPKQE